MRSRLRWLFGLKSIRIVLEIAFDAIRESPRHNSGLALRFPRIVRLRRDKNPDDIDTLQTSRRLLGK
jgi:DNA ligase-1